MNSKRDAIVHLLILLPAIVLLAWLYARGG